jgi:hypothetical protein
MTTEARRILTAYDCEQERLKPAKGILIALVLSGLFWLFAYLAMCAL